MNEKTTNEKALARTNGRQDSGLAVRAEQNTIRAAIAAEVPMIAELDQEYRYRLPRQGKIHLGVKAKTQGGKEYPKATDYFVLPDELSANDEFRAALEALGQDPEKPRALPIMLPCNALMGNLRSSCDLYGSSRGLLCRTFDGLTCGRVDTKTGEIITEACTMLHCGHHKSGDCHWIHRLRVILPDAPFGGVWQIDTTSPNNRTNLLTEMRQIREMLGGHLGGVDLTLTLEPQEFQIPILDKRTGETEVRKTTAYLMHIRSMLSLRKLEVAAKDARAYDSAEVQDFDYSIDDLTQVQEVDTPAVDEAGGFQAGEEPADPEPDAPIQEAETVEDETTDEPATVEPSDPEKAEAERVLLIEDIERRRCQLGKNPTEIARRIQALTGKIGGVKQQDIATLRKLAKELEEKP